MYDIFWIPSYVSFPSCLLNTSRISALRLCWISGCSASSYRAKLRVLPEVSKPAIRNANACATNKSPSISEKEKQSYVKVNSSLCRLVTCKFSLYQPYFCGSESTVCRGYTHVLLHNFHVPFMRYCLLSCSRSVLFCYKHTFDSHNRKPQYRNLSGCIYI